ncbi:MAG: DUF1292 domain-containing protein [Clostridium sp.]|nr:DUF1292 domain-containing protein [Clostridium sp.]MDD7139812.1 DUF1292 domain-containing protein [Clostridium sp.]MDY6080615.1 DUF1292 domain-containing protein [Eubacteriales bacterium]
MEENTIVTLLDENGKEVQFDLVMTFDYEGKRYAALLPMDDVDGVADDEVVLLEIVREGGDETYRAIENPVLLDEVFNEFIELFDETFDDEEDE